MKKICTVLHVDGCACYEQNYFISLDRTCWLAKLEYRFCKPTLKKMLTVTTNYILCLWKKSLPWIRFTIKLKHGDIMFFYIKS